MELEDILFLLGGSVLGGYGERSRNKKQKALSQQMTAYKLGKSRESTAATENYINSLTPEARAAETPAIRAELDQSLRDSVGVTQAYQKPDNFSGKVSERYGTARDAEKRSTDARIEQAIANLTTLGVPAERDQRRQVRFNTAATDIGQANRAAGNVGQAHVQAMNLAQPNRLLSYAGEVMRGIGQARALKKKPTAPKPKPVEEISELD